MKYSKLMLIMVFAIFICTVSATCAADANETTIATQEDNQMELTLTEDEIQTNENDNMLTQTEDAEILTSGEGSYSDLRNDINSGGNLTKSHYRYNAGDGDTIEINTPGVINGNGAVIDMAESNIRTFYVRASGVTIKNLTIINANHNGNGGAIYFDTTGTVSNCNFINNKATGGYVGGGAIRMLSGTVANCNFTDNKATGEGSYGGAIRMDSGSVSNCNFTGNTASHNGGAVYFSGTGEVTNCNFINNKATGHSASGGAIMFVDTGEVANCNFVDNKATVEGGAIFSSGQYTTADTCIFKRNSGDNVNTVIYPPTLNVDNFTTVYGSGEKLTFDLKTNSSIPVTNWNISISVYFKNGTWFDNYSCLSGEGWIPNLPVGLYHAIFNTEYANFQKINRTLKISDGTTFWDLNQTINVDTQSEINLINNYTFNPDYDADFVEGIVINRTVTIKGNGNAIDAKRQARIFYVQSANAVLENLTLKNAHSNSEGGAVYFSGTGEVTNCNFTDNSAPFGGAVYFYQGTGTVSNCNFANNTANNDGGAVYFDQDGVVSYCNFTDNYAVRGGAISMDHGSVSNCNFTGNNATTGSAIYFYSILSTKTVFNSRFLNNRANAEVLEVTKNDNNITITFTGRNNLLNAIYSINGAKVTFTNVTYWGANGITTVNATMSGSNKATGQNITVGVVVNDRLVLSGVKVTDDNGMIVLPIIAGENYYISARHDTDSYYTEAERTISNNTKFNVNVTSQTTTNKTVNITAKSNIPNDVVKGKLLFILPNGTQIEATYGANGTWWAEHTFDACGEYKINATYVGLDNVTINNGTITINKVNSTITLDDIVLDYGETKNVTVTTTGATGITAKIGESDVKVDGFVISIPALDAGTYTLTVTAIADNNHNNVTKNATIIVNKLKTELTGSAITTTYNINKDLVITLKDSTGKALSGVKVTVDLNGAKTYTTDKNGQVKVSTKGIAPKAYTAKVTFNGYTNYDKSTKDIKVIVKKATPKLTAKKKTFKTTPKTKKYTIVLKDNAGKAIKKAKVTLKVKGKTYKATTNSKGKATFKITKLNKKGTFKATITYKGNKYYNKVSKKANIKVIVTFKTVSKGSKDKATVKEIQQALKDKGYYLTYQGHYLKVDGKFSSCTFRSVKEFQHDKGLKVTGKVDEKTAHKLGII